MSSRRGLIDIIGGVISNKCPRCLEGNVYGGLFRMNETCPNCGVKFEREPGYFTGAMAVSYIIGFFAILPTLAVLLFIDASFTALVVIPSMELIVLAPFTMRWARLAWLYIDSGFER